MKAKLKAENLIMYTETLVDTVNSKLEDFKPKGEFRKNILLLTDPLPTDSPEHILLDKMLVATGLSTADVYHIQLEQQFPVSLINKMEAKQVICFGGFLNSPSLQFTSQLYRITQINDIEILMTHNLNKISNDNQLKQALWNALKKMFQL